MATASATLTITITHNCGHSCRPQFHGTESERQQFISVREARPCRACNQADIAALQAVLQASGFRQEDYPG